ncbi:MAG: recombinase family protein [Clostridium sp.]|nr:recombinase family protein [Acetatifactor muris]MCM1526087.1 recombinase family protein [Bacteroides sp.]MCM1562154.1 recombinase family protein [Clostridium sp.]
MERVGIYNRCSTEEEAQVNALAGQAEESREIAERMGWIVTAQYIESESGTSTGKRTEYRRMLEDMETDLFDIVMIKSIDRLMRSTGEWYRFLDRLVQNQKRLYIYIDRKFYTAEDSLITGIKAILAEDFSRELSKKIKNAHHRRQERRTGLNISVPMFGWDRISANEFVINEREAERYREAFRMAGEGVGFYTISNYMYDRGVRGKNDGKISASQWRNMLYTPRAHGTVVMHREEYDFDTKRKIPVPPEEWIYCENALPAIVSKAYQEEVLEILTRRKVKCGFDNYTRDMSKTGLYELSGKLICGDCGRVYYRIPVSTTRGTLIEWKCSGALQNGRLASNHNGCDNINLVEEEVFRLMGKVFTERYGGAADAAHNASDAGPAGPPRGAFRAISEEAFALIEEELGESHDGRAKRELQREYDRLRGKKELLFQKLLAGTIEDADFKRYHAALSERMEVLFGEIRDIEERETTYNNDGERLRQIREALRGEPASEEATARPIGVSGGVPEESAADRTIATGAVERALSARVRRITVHHDGMLELDFDRAGLEELIGVLGCGDPKLGGISGRRPAEFLETGGVTADEAEKSDSNGIERSVVLWARYIHKTNTTKRREAVNQRILELLKENPELRLRDVAERTGRKLSYVQQSVSRLKAEGRLRYARGGKGADGGKADDGRAGRWIVTAPGGTPNRMPDTALDAGVDFY